MNDPVTVEHPAVAFDRRADDARDARYKHVNAANNWLLMAEGEKDPAKKTLYEALSAWMVAVADADGKAERALRELAARLRVQSSCAHRTPACDACIEHDTILAHST